MDIKKEFDATIGPMPVSSIDVDVTMTKMRRRLWTVRSTVAATVAGLMTAGVMLAWPMLTSSTPGQASVVLPPAAPAQETEQELADRLTVAVQAKLSALVPGATLIPNWDGHDAAVVYPERPVGVPTTLPWNQMRAQADMRDDQGSGFVDVLIGRTVADPNATAYCDSSGAVVVRSNGQTQAPSGDCSVRAPVGYPLGVYTSCADYDEVLDGNDECTEQVTAGGDHVVILRGTNEYRIDVRRADGTAVIVMSGSRGRTGGTRPSPSLTIEQMIALATDSGLGL